MSEIMKTTKIFSILAVLAFVLTGCQDDFGKNFKPAEVGDEIFFGGTAGYEPEGRTAYGDKVKGENGYTEIKWYAGDAVRIYSAQARKVNGNSYCDYTVNNVVPQGEDPKADKHEGKNSSSLTSAEAYGLQWGEGADANGTHYFYGVYPSPKMFAEGSQEATSYNLNGNSLTAYLPSSQNPKTYVAAKNGDYIIHPAMRYAYMTAYTSANHTSDGVTMSFTPIVTAVEISIINNSHHDEINSSNVVTSTEEISIKDITEVTVSTTDGSAITGTFTADVENGVVTSVNGNSYVKISTLDEKSYPITLAPGKKLTFTVFMVRDESDQDNMDLSSLKVALTVGGNSKSATLHANENILVEAKKKNFIYDVPLELNTTSNSKEVGYEQWMSQIKGDTPIGMMSIPGAGGAGSHKITDASVKQQEFSITQLWNLGVRCFEMTTDNNERLSSGNVNIVCNSYDTDVKLSSAISEIEGLLEAHPTEYAIVIIGYQPTVAQFNGAYGRQSANWSNYFYTYWTSVNNWNKPTDVKNEDNTNIVCETMMYNPNMQLKDARGKLFCFSRPTAIGADPWWYSLPKSPNNVLAIPGWGPLPDQWYQRGYTRNNQPFIINQDNPVTTRTYTQQGTNFLYPYYENITGLTNGNNSVHLQDVYGSADKKFLYRTMAPSEEDIVTFTGAYNVNAQEWRRVVKSEFTAGPITRKGMYYLFGNIEKKYYYYWRESLTEKKNDILSALNRATNATDYSTTIYINSLCGFYLTSDQLSYTPQPHRLRFYAKTENEVSAFNDIKYEDYFYEATSKNGGQLAYDYFGGTKGDIATAAQELNEYFYKELVGIGVDNLNGPTGIILMDRIKDNGDTEANKPGYHLPQMIVDNCRRQFAKHENDNIQ